jgi:divalent metal cation (Fe/Co/Zn/Cd) transporter
MPAPKPMIKPDRKPTLLQVVISVLAAFFGVQSSRNRARDFTHGKAISFVLVGISLTVLLVGILVLIVKLVVSAG